MENYLIVLFNNKKRKQIIKKFVTLSRAKNFYNKMMDESSNVIFETLVKNGKECKLELSIVEIGSKQTSPLYMTDEFGRNIKVSLEDDGMVLREINLYKKEDLLYDINKKKKISVQEIIKNYLNGDGLKMISILNNKVILQKDENIYLFSLKSESECSRFVSSLSLYFFKIKRNDCLFISDCSVPQKKYLYDLLESNGISKKILYRKFTTYSPHLK